MTIELHPHFKKSFKKHIQNNPKSAEQTSERLKLFINNPGNPILKDHRLKGEKSDLRAFSITGDIRIVYKKITDDHLLFLDIGTHNQVY